MRLWLNLIKFSLFGLTLSLCVESVHAQVSEIRTLDPTKSLTQYVHQQWDSGDGLPQNSINAISNTPDGFLWLGTQEGLVRFDGLEFRVFNQSNVDAFASDDIRVLTLDDRGCFMDWDADAGLVKYRDGIFSGGEVDSTLDQSRVTAIKSARSGNHMWVGTSNDGVWKVSKGEAERIEVLPSELITSLVEDSRGNLWIGTRDAGLLRLSNGEVEVYALSTGFPSDDVTSLALDPVNDKLWVGTRKDGVVCLEGDKLERFSTESGLPNNQVLSLFVDERGVVWVGSDQAGLNQNSTRKNA